MSAVSTPTFLNGMYKYIFGTKQIPFPDYTKLLNDIPMYKAKMLGRNFIFPVQVADEQGITANSDGTAYTLNASQSFETNEATVQGTEISVVGQISNKAITAGRTDQQSFGNVLALKIERLMESHAKYAEYQMLYGGSGARATAYTAGTATTGTITIPAASWSPAFWNGSKAMRIQFYANDDSTLISSGADSIFSVSSVNFATQQIGVTGTATGITALAGATYTGGGLFIYRNGVKGKEMRGLNLIATTSTGTQFGIDSGANEVWRANNITTTGALNFTKILEATEQAASRGALGRRMKAYLPIKQWNTLSADAASLRRLDSSYKKDKFGNGFDLGGLQFETAVGTLAMVPHPMVRNGDVFIIDPNVIKRVGSQEITMENQNEKGNYFYPMNAAAGWEVRTYSDFAIVPEEMYSITKLSGFTA
jgi:hypothetical protein